MAKQLNEILVEQGKLTPEQDKQVQLYAKQNNISIADAILRFGFATEEQVTIALSKHFSIPYASKENGILVPEREQNLQEIINEKFARENMVVPLKLLTAKSPLVIISIPTRTPRPWFAISESHTSTSGIRTLLGKIMFTKYVLTSL